MSSASQSAPDWSLDAFIARWSGREGGQERANYSLFLTEFCSVLDLPQPEPASARAEHNDYVFERVLRRPTREGGATAPRIDLYKRDCFILEAKQSRLKGQRNELIGHNQGPSLPSWDALMFNARRQAENYVPLLPSDHAPPPFLVICDVGRCFETYANFRRDGKVYDQFPDRQGFRVTLDDLRDEDARARMRSIWTDPLALDPARRSARVTRAIAERLAAVSRALETRAFPPEEVAAFLTRCLFTMFAEDVGLLPQAAFKSVLERCEASPDKFVPMVEQLWAAMDRGGFAYAIETHVRRFNGEFFKRRTVLPIGREEIGELRQAAAHDWREVDPSIFGTLLEQALDPKERRRLGAHYTPRAYVERLVVATVIEPLRADWDQARATADRQQLAGNAREAAKTVRAFHETLCATRILDPAVGTANFLYVALELMKRLEGEVLEALNALGAQEALTGLEGHTVDPRQFLGLEVNPRAAAIAELVLWIGYLQWSLRTRGGLPNDPVLKAYGNIREGDAVLKAERVLARDAGGRPLTRPGSDGTPVETYDYRDPRRPDWPDAEFIVGNPPFIGGKDLRARLGDGYAQALWAAHPDMNESADFVMYWWDRAAELLGRKGTVLRRFGFVTTNSISQVFQRRVVQRHRSAKRPVSIVMAIPDHPWVRGPETAAVRIAMTVVEAGTQEGVLRETTQEAGLDSDAPVIELNERIGTINADLTVGADVTKASALLANEGLCSPGVKLHGAGFIVTPAEAEHLGLGRRDGLERHIRTYRNGRDLTARPRGVMVIDLLGLSSEDVRYRFPEVYQQLLRTVKPERDINNRESYRTSWWTFGEPRRDLRPALAGLPRYIATVETTKHRIFQFLDASILPDNMLVAVGSADAFHLGVLSSRQHIVWALRAGGWLGIGNDPRYSKSRCFDPFPFPEVISKCAPRIRHLAETLDAHRSRVLAAYRHLTLTGLYNVLEQVRAGAPLNAAEQRIFDDGLVLILKELHDDLDAAVAEAYGWPADLADDQILDRLVILNKARQAEEERGLVRWLRPEFQIGRFGSARQKAELDRPAGEVLTRKAAPKPSYPAPEAAQTAVIMAALARSPSALDAETIASGFKQGRRIGPKVDAVLVSLCRMGIIASLESGRRFALRRPT